VDAVTTYANEAPDCIFMDLQMPEMDGVEATRAIREIEAVEKRCPASISALSANTMPESQERCLREGMNALLTKPLKRHSIMDILVTTSDVLHPAD